MKKTFDHYYAPSDKDFEDIFKSAIIVLDTNVLLDFFRSSEKTTDELLSVLRAAKEQLWLPYQVGLEYHENIDSVIGEIRRRHESFAGTLEDGLNKLRSSFSDYRHPFIRESVLAEVDALEGRLVQELLSTWNIAKLNARANSVRSQIEELYDDGKIGPALSNEHLEEIYKEGEQRYKDQIPPGFKDARKTGDPRRRFGDLILWKQVLAKAKDSGCPIILVTDDAKDDWWLRVTGETVGPLPALRLEMTKETGQRFQLYTSEQFLKHGARAFLRREANVQALEDVERATRAEQLRDVVADQRNAVRSDVKLRENAQCPRCDEPSESTLGEEVGSSAWSVCGACGLGFHIHRDRNGGVFTSAPFSRGNTIASQPASETSALIDVKCPNCDQPVNWYLGRAIGSTAKPHCESCNRWFHAHRAQDGLVIIRAPGDRATF